MAVILEGEASPRNRSNHPPRTALFPQATWISSDHFVGLDPRQWSRRLDLGQDRLTDANLSFPALVLLKPKAQVSTQETELGSLDLLMSLLCSLTSRVYSVGILGRVAKGNFLGFFQIRSFCPKSLGYKMMKWIIVRLSWAMTWGAVPLSMMCFPWGGQETQTMTTETCLFTCACSFNLPSICYYWGPTKNLCAQYP